MGEIRVVVDAELHRKLKQKALDKEMSLKQLVTETLKKEVQN